MQMARLGATHAHIIACRGKGTALSGVASTAGTSEAGTPCMVLAMDFAAGGDLLSAVRSAGHHGLGDSAATRAGAAQLASALAFCHAHGVAHRDVKPENILQCGSASAPCWKLADFGAASVSSSDPSDSPSSRPPQLIQSSRAIGSDAYAAPEVVAVMDACAAANAGSGPTTLPSYEVYGVDVWSFGVTLFVLASGRPPFRRPSGSDPAFLGFCAATQPTVLTANAAAVAPGWRWPAHFSRGLIELLTGCLQVDTRYRLSSHGLCASPWLQLEPVGAASSLPVRLIGSDDSLSPQPAQKSSGSAADSLTPPFSPRSSAASLPSARQLQLPRLDGESKSVLSPTSTASPNHPSATSSRFPSLASAACVSENATMSETSGSLLFSARPRKLSNVATARDSMPVLQESASSSFHLSVLAAQEQGV